MGIVYRIRKLFSAAYVAKQYYKNGGISKVIVTTPLYDNILEGKSVLITGGSSGIGFAIAKKCVECGAKVVITGRDEVRLKEAAGRIGLDRCYYQVWDIADTSSIQEELNKCKEHTEADIDILVNNAGVAPSKFFGNTDEAEWNRIYNINLKGNFFLTQEIVRQWRLKPFSGYKKIINISSQGGFVGATYPYRMVKWDVRGLTEGLGKMLVKDNIIVNGIAPGIVKTAMQEFAMHQGDNLYTNQNPIGRVCLPEEIAELALFLISDTSNFIVGQTIVCDGGYTLK